MAVVIEIAPGYQGRVNVAMGCDKFAGRFCHDGVASLDVGDQFVRRRALGCCVFKVTQANARVPVETAAIGQEKVKLVPARQENRSAPGTAYQFARARLPEKRFAISVKERNLVLALQTEERGPAEHPGIVKTFGRHCLAAYSPPV